MAPPAGQTAAVAEAAGDGGAQPQQRQAGGIGSTISGIVRIAVFWYFASKFFSPKQKPMDPSQSHLMTNLFHKGESLVYFFPRLTTPPIHISSVIGFCLMLSFQFVCSSARRICFV